MSRYWKDDICNEANSQNNRSQTSQDQLITTTREEHLNVDSRSSKQLKHHNNCLSETHEQPSKKEFLKKGSRKSLACSGYDANTHRDKENTVSTSINKPKSIEDQNVKRDGELNYRVKRGKTLEREVQCPTPIKVIQSGLSLKNYCCVPPQLLVSRLTGNQITRQQTPSVTRKVFSDGRIALHYKQMDIHEQYLSNMVLTQWPNGDWKLQHTHHAIYRLESLNSYQIDGRII